MVERLLIASTAMIKADIAEKGKNFNSDLRFSFIFLLLRHYERNQRRQTKTDHLTL